MPCPPGQDFQDSQVQPCSLSSQSHTGMRICPLCWGPNRKLWSDTWTLCCHSPFTCKRWKSVPYHSVGGFLLDLLVLCPLQGIARDLTLVLDSNFPLLLSTPEIPSWVHKFHLPSPACPSLFQNIVMLCVYFNASQNTCTLTVNIYWETSRAVDNEDGSKEFLLCVAFLFNFEFVIDAAHGNGFPALVSRSR